MSRLTTTHNDLGSLEFELTDLDTARQVLDDLPPGIEEVRRLSPGYWEQRRRPPAPTDRVLAGHTLEWMSKLPVALRPSRLAERYPRVANQLATTWTSGMECSATFDDLLVDHRGGRIGFPYDVEVEIKELKQYRQVLVR